MVILPAPIAERSSGMIVCVLFGAWFTTSIVPATSPPGVVTVMVPVVTRDVTLASASRPPPATMPFSMMSSAVCADAAAPTRTKVVSSTPLAITRMDHLHFAEDQIADAVDHLY